ncbi:MAG TPA: hypothetical protein VMZ31_17510 [Phycisphaerae bacterium]|nr:hypothetical protein [Phycisphaerae bacterium]
MSTRPRPTAEPLGTDGASPGEASFTARAASTQGVTWRISWRRLAAGMLTGCVAAAIVFVAIRPTYRAQGVVSWLGGARADPHVLAGVVADLMGPQVFSAVEKRTAFATVDLGALVETGRLRAFASDGANAVVVETLDTDCERAVTRLDALVGAYLRQSDQAVARQAELVGRRREISDRLEAARLKWDLLLYGLAESSSDTALSDRVLELVQAGQQCRSLGEQLREVEAELARLSGAPIVANVDPDVLARAEAEDELLGSDVAQLREVYARFAAHLVEASAGATDALEALLGLAAGARRTVQAEADARQQDELGHALAELLPVLTEYGSQVESLTRQWLASRQELQQAAAAEAGETVLDLQRAIAQRLGDFADRGSRLLERAQAAADELGLVDTHPTKRAVVQAVVGRVLRGLRRGHDAFVAVGGEVLLGQNFRLDGLHHSAVGLARRVEHRRGQIEASLRQQAERQARRQRAARIEQLTALRRQLAGQQQQWIDQIIAQHQRVCDDLGAAAAVPLDQLAATGQTMDTLRGELAGVNARLASGGVHVLPGVVQYPGARVIGEPANQRTRLGAAAIVLVASSVAAFASSWSRTRRASAV